MKGQPHRPHKPIKIVKHHHDGEGHPHRPRSTPAGGQADRTNPTTVAAIWITVGLVAVGGLFWAIHAVRQQVYRDRLIAIEMQKTKDKAEVTCADVETSAAAIAAMAEPAMAKAKEVHRIMVTILGEVAEKPEPDSRTSRTTSPVRRSGTAVSRGTGDDDEDDRDRPEGIMSREARLAQIEAERRRNEARKKETTVGSLNRGGTTSSTTPGGSGTGTAYSRRTTSREEPRIQALERKTKNLSEAIERKGLTAREMESSALRFKSLVLTQKLYVKVQKRAADLEKLLVEIRKVEEDAKGELQQVETYAAEAGAIEKAHLDELARIAAAKEAERKAEEHAALVQREIARAGDTRRFNRELVEKNEFGEALRSATDALARFRTDEGRAKLTILKDKYDRLVALKEFLISRLTSDPMSFGWIQDGPKVDILGADASGVKTRNKLTPWSNVTLPQMIKFIDFYLASEKIPVSQRGSHGFSAAIYFHELGKPEVADVYLERATTLLPDLQTEATRLLGE